MSRSRLSPVAGMPRPPSSRPSLSARSALLPAMTITDLAIPGVVWSLCADLNPVVDVHGRRPASPRLPYEAVQSMAAGETVASAIAGVVVAVGVDVGPAAGVRVVPARLLNGSIRQVGLQATVVSAVSVPVSATPCKDFRDPHVAPFSADGGGAMQAKGQDQPVNSPAATRA